MAGNGGKVGVHARIPAPFPAALALCYAFDFDHILGVEAVAHRTNIRANAATETDFRKLVPDRIVLGSGNNLSPF